jgi:serine/threonine-protein kinase
MSETLLNGRYALVAQQGSGGMSVIYRAVDRMLGRNVAVKILRPSLTQDPSFLEKFRNEARSIANLSHPNIVTVFDVGNDGATHYIVMELIDGEDLKKKIKAQGAMPLDAVLDIATQICAGIGYAHRSGIVHADIKPQNVLMTAEMKVKVTDFGIAQALSDTQPQQRADVVWGSPHYFSPEQARGEQPTPASDVYSIGIVMFEMLTGRLPFTGTNQQELAMAHIRDRVPLVTEFNPAVPEGLATIVQKVMSKDAAGRYRTADQLGQLLQSFRDKARSATISNPNLIPPVAAPPAPAVTAPSAPAPAAPQGAPAGGIPAPVNRPPGVGATPYTPPVSADPTVRFSPAPSAPQPYNPRQQQAAVQPAQSLEQRFTAPPQPGVPLPGYQPQQGRPFGTDPNQYYPPNSQPMRPITREETGIDWVTIALGVLAVVAVLGLIPLWITALAAR